MSEYEQRKQVNMKSICGADCNNCGYGKTVKLLDDNDIYLGNQVECGFNDGELIKCFGLVAGLDFILVSEYGENCSSLEIIVYKKR